MLFFFLLHRRVLETVVDAQFGESLPHNSPETALVLQSLFLLANAKQQLCPATLPGTRATESALRELLPMQQNYVFTVVPGVARRTLLLCVNLNCYLISTRLFVTNVTRFFPPHFASEQTNLSLLDGELIDSRRFLVTDAIAVRGTSCRPLNLAARLEMFARAFGPHLTPLPSWYPASEADKSLAFLESVRSPAEGEERVAVALQRYFEVSQFAAVTQSVQPHAEWNGSVKFLAKEERYKLGLNKNVLLWRPVSCVFVDFVLRRMKPSADAPQRSDFQLLKEDAQGQMLLHDYISDVDKQWPVWDGCVAECFWNPEGTTFVVDQRGKSVEYRGGWQVSRLRYDRLDSNPHWIVARLVAEIDGALSLADVTAILRHEKTSAARERDAESPPPPPPPPEEAVGTARANNGRGKKKHNGRKNGGTKAHNNNNNNNHNNNHNNNNNSNSKKR